MIQLGIITNPLEHRDWPLMEAFLEPAAKRGNVPILEDGELVWVVYDGDDLAGVATARLTFEGFGEVILVGGKNANKWIHDLDFMLCNWMRDEGMKSMRAYGRKGWTRVLHGWAVIGSDGKALGYEKVL